MVNLSLMLEQNKERREKKEETIWNRKSNLRPLEWVDEVDFCFGIGRELFIKGAVSTETAGKSLVFKLCLELIWLEDKVWSLPVARLDVIASVSKGDTNSRSRGWNDDPILSLKWFSFEDVVGIICFWSSSDSGNILLWEARLPRRASPRFPRRRGRTAKDEYWCTDFFSVVNVLLVGILEDGEAATEVVAVTDDFLLIGRDCFVFDVLKLSSDAVLNVTVLFIGIWDGREDFTLLDFNEDNFSKF